MSRAREKAKLNPATEISLQVLNGVAGSFPCFTADDVFRAANIAGTVSQSSGVPTGAVIESGSNANGYYVKWADGTMMCANLSGTSYLTNTGAGPVYVYNASITLTFPATFIAYPQVMDASRFGHPTNGNAGTARGWVQPNTGATTACSLVIFGYQTTSGMFPGYIATGRWF